jgi:glycerol-1-phosphate dehydrogenase [NAD(P)+]
VSTITFNPNDLPGFYRQASEMSSKDRTLGLSNVRVGENLLNDPLSAVQFKFRGSERSVLIVCDETEILRNGTPLKTSVFAALENVGVDYQVLVLTTDTELHTTPAEIGRVKELIKPRMDVISLGSGTVADITKHAVFEYETEAGEKLDLTVVQTANSVCAFTSGLAVITAEGVKRTVPSRLPDNLVLDTTVLAQAPRAYTLGGIGDSSVAASSIADYRLANMLQVGGWDPVAWKVVEEGRNRFLSKDAALADPGIVGATRLALDLSACGLAMTFAGESAPLSGLEHVTSHMLDLSANHFGRAVGNHGSQCGLATVLVLIAFEHLIEKVDVSSIDLAGMMDRLDERQELDSVKAAFNPIDPSGAVWRECWSDYKTKLDAWTSNTEALKAFQKSWVKNRTELQSYLTSPEQFMSSLAATGHSLFFEDVFPGIPEEEARWAFSNARLMRKRISVADVLYFFGAWDDEFIDSVFARFHSIRESLASS